MRWAGAVWNYFLNPTHMTLRPTTGYWRLRNALPAGQWPYEPMRKEAQLTPCAEARTRAR